MLERVIKHGTLVTAAGLRQADVGIRGETIVAMGSDLAGGELIDATGLLVIPGGVDAHVHLEMPAGQITTSDTWATGTHAAAFGGTTTVIDFVEPADPGQPLLEACAQRQEQALGAAAVDFALHMTLCDARASTLAQIPGVIAAGLPSFKLYTTYPGFHLQDAELLLALEAIAQAGGLAMVHAESDALIQHATRRLQSAGRLATGDFPTSRPALAEVEAIERVLSLAKYTGTPLYFAHVSTRGGAAAIARARQAGQAAWGETCPQYLLLDESRLHTPDFSGAQYICCPPLRGPADQDALWQALQAGELQAIATDHCAFNFSGQKDANPASFTTIPAGLPGIELRLALAYSFGVLPGRISLAQWVDLCCTAPARRFGLHPRKGELAIGADADIVLFDPAPRSVVTRALLHENVDYTPYAGLTLTGKVDTTLLRGQVLVRAGQWLGGAGTGIFIAGSRAPEGSHLQ